MAEMGFTAEEVGAVVKAVVRAERQRSAIQRSRESKELREMASRLLAEADERSRVIREEIWPAIYGKADNA